MTTLSNKHIRRTFSLKQNHDICAAHFWKRKLDIDVSDYFNLAYECTKESRLRLLHFKFMHNIYPTNILLQKMGVTETNRCLHCGEIDFIEHAFYSCHQLSQFWGKVKQYILTQYDYPVPMNVTTALFGIPKTVIFAESTRKAVNCVLLIAKLSISKFKYGKCKNLDMIFEMELKLRSK